MSKDVPTMVVQPDGTIIIREGFSPVTFLGIRVSILNHGKRLAPSHVFNVEEVQRPSETFINGRCLRETIKIVKRREGA